MVCTDRLNQLFVTSFNISDSIMGTRILQNDLEKGNDHGIYEAVPEAGHGKDIPGTAVSPRRRFPEAHQGFKILNAITRPKIGGMQKVVNSTAGISIM